MTTPNELQDVMPAEQWHNYVDAWCNGWAAGLDEGRRRADAEAAARHRAAAGVVLAMTKVPVRDRDADHAAAERRAARWSK